MADAIYPLYKQALLEGATIISITTSNVKAVLVDTGTSPYNAAHDFLNDISAGVVSTSPNLTGKTVTNGVFDCADFVFTAVSGATVEAIVYYIDTGVSTTSRLIAFKDSGTGLAVTPNGGDINITVNGSGVFAL